MNKVQELPKRENVALKDDVITYEPKYAQPQALAKIVGVSRTTIFRLLKSYHENNCNIENLEISLSPTLKVINIEKFIAFMQAKHNQHLNKA
ncbi:helix-turn-helix domain-containing protein [Macrococcus capreoli]